MSSSRQVGSLSEVLHTLGVFGGQALGIVHFINARFVYSIGLAVLAIDFSHLVERLFRVSIFVGDLDLGDS